MVKDNETWILDVGNAVIQRLVVSGMADLKPLDRLVYCLWVADYGMRNAGDLTTASELNESFQHEALHLSRELDLPVTRSAFALPRAVLGQQYFQRFDGICDEIRAAQASKHMPSDV